MVNLSNANYDPTTISDWIKQNNRILCFIYFHIIMTIIVILKVYRLALKKDKKTDKKM